jgi:hypothetical protein
VTITATVASADVQASQSVLKQISRGYYRASPVDKAPKIPRALQLYDYDGYVFLVIYYLRR